MKDPQQLVEVRIAGTPRGRTGQFSSRRPNLTNPLWERIRDRQQAFSKAFVWSAVGFTMTNGGEARYASGLWVSGDFFNALGITPVVGRMVTPDDDRRGCAAPPAVISYGFWRREYGGNPSAIGRSVMLDGHAYDIIGVSPASFFGGGRPRLRGDAGELSACSQGVAFGADRSAARGMTRDLVIG